MGLQLRSDRISDRLSEAAIRLWNRFERQGIAQKVDDRYIFIEDPQLFELESLSPSESADENYEIGEQENNENLTQGEEIKDINNELISKFDDLLNNGTISQICI